MELRRTASWGSRDAFTDGHLSHHSNPPTSQSQGKRGTSTARAHAFRKYHPAYKPRTGHAVSGPSHAPSSGVGHPLLLLCKAPDMCWNPGFRLAKGGGLRLVCTSSPGLNSKFTFYLHRAAKIFLI